MKKLLLTIFLALLVSCGSADPCDPNMLDCSECADMDLCAATPTPSATPEATPTPEPTGPVCENEECTMLSVIRSPTAAANTGIAPEAWANVNNIFSSNNTYATATLDDPSPTFTANLTGTNFGFALPPHVPVVGAEILLEGLKSNSNYSEDYDAEAFVEGIGSVFSSAAWSLSTSEGIVTIGSPTNLAGQGWVGADFNTNDLLVRVNLELALVFTPNPTTYSIDHMQLRLYYEQVGDLGHVL